jgi:hypothetical protein
MEDSSAYDDAIIMDLIVTGKCLEILRDQKYVLLIMQFSAKEESMSCISLKKFLICNLEVG